MLGLQKLFDEQIESLFNPNKLGASFIENGLKGIGIFLTNSQRSALEEQFSRIDSGCLTFNFSDEQIQEAGYYREEDLDPKLRSIIDNIPISLDKLLNNIDDTMKSVVDGVTDSISELILEALESRMSEMLDDQCNFYSTISHNIEEIWGEPLNLLQGLIVISDESAQGYFSRTDEYAESNITQEVLVRIHAKSVQIAKEIFTLLRNGFPDGAQARWRTLHELSVTSVFISEHGNEVAERYVNHDAINSYKAAVQYNDYYTRLGAEPVSAIDMENLHKDYLALLDKYGQSYQYDYGWAAAALNQKRPTFRDIEASIDLDHHRPYYKAASANIHGNPAGVFRSLGLFPEEDVILSGPSNIGLTEPAQSTIISLNIITTTTLTYGANIDFIVISKVISKYGRKVEDAFIAVELEISNALENK